jgi:hypothetical protein
VVITGSWLASQLASTPLQWSALSQSVSQQEYSKLFERDRFGFVSSTEYSSRGDWIQSGAQYGNLGDFGYAVDTLYRSEHGQRLNNDQDQLTLSAQFKYDVTTRDSILCRLTAASSAEQRCDAASSFRWWAEQEGLLLQPS